MMNPGPQKSPIVGVPIQSQIDFLKDCYRVAGIGLIKASDKLAIDRANRALTHLEATIQILESILKDESDE